MALYIMPCALAVDFEELDGSPVENLYALGAGKSTITRNLRCKAIDRARLIMEFLGWTGYVGADVVIHRPASYLTPSGWLYAFSADTIPQGRIQGAIGDSRFADYEWSNVTVKYGPPELLESAYGGLVEYRETFTSANEFTTFPQENLYWGTGGGKVPLDVLDAPGVVVVMTEWVIEISKMRTLPTFENYIGKINSTGETSYSGSTFAAGTLLCSGIETVQNTSYGQVGGVPAYTTTWDVTMRFLYRPQGWNFFPRPSEGGTSVSWERITDGTVNKNFYESVDFTGLIFVPS